MRLTLALLALGGGAILIVIGQVVFSDATAAPNPSPPGEVILTTSGPVDSARLELSVVTFGFDRLEGAPAQLLTTLHVRSADEVTFWLWLMGTATQDIPAGQDRTPVVAILGGDDHFTRSGSWVMQVVHAEHGNTLTLLTSTVRDVDHDGQIALQFTLQAEQMVQPTTSGLTLQLPLMGPEESYGSGLDVFFDAEELEIDGYRLEGADSLPDGYMRGYSSRQPSQLTSVIRVEGFRLDDSLQSNPPPDSWVGADFGPQAVWGPTDDRLGVEGSISNQTQVANNQRRQFLAGVAVGLGGGLLVLAVEQAVEAYGARAGRRVRAQESKRAERRKLAEHRYRRARRHR